MSKSRDTSELAEAVVSLTVDVSGKVENGGNVTAIRKLTQAEYDGLTPDPTTVYIIVG